MEHNQNADIESDTLRIVGLNATRSLTGTIPVAYSKNAILPAIASVVLFDSSVVLKNIPAVSDVASILRILKTIGIDYDTKGGDIHFQIPSTVDSDLPAEEFVKTRGAITLSGPCIARTGSCRIPNVGPGGCLIGKRPINFYLDFYRALGVSIMNDKNDILCQVPHGGLHGTEFTFPKKSVTGTATAVMTALLATGITTLRNCALEPEVGTLFRFLVDNGANIRGIDTETISIDGTGGVPLKATVPFTNIPDRIETGSWLILACLVGNNITIKNCIPQHIRFVIKMLNDIGIPGITEFDDSITVQIPKGFSLSTCKPLQITTKEYPGFPTDLQTPILILATQVGGSSVIKETIFERRVLSQVAELNKFGLNIECIDESKVIVHGSKHITPQGTQITVTDIRAGFAYILSAILARGESTVLNKHIVDRGYENIVERLQNIGVTVT